MPDNFSFTSAIIIPAVYGIAYHALHDIARVKKGATATIHSDAGGLT